MSSSRGFSLVELVVAIAIFGILAVVAAPAFGTWISNMKVRSTAESIQAGLNLARAEAVRRNMQVRFQFVTTLGNDCANSTTDANWVVSLETAAGACGGAFLNDAFPVDDTTNNPDPKIIQMKAAREGGSGVNVSAGASTFLFNGLGRLVSAPAAVDVTFPASGVCKTVSTPGPVRCLRVVVTSGGQVRMCDPAYPAGDPQACS